MPADNILLRAAESDDWPAIEALLLASGLPTEGAREHLPSFVLAVANGTIVGSSGFEVHDDEALLRSVAVVPGRQQQGVGHLMVSHLVRQARSLGLSSMHLLTTTATGYFARHGFTLGKIEEAPSALRASAEFNGACPASAAFMSLLLAGTSKPAGEARSTIRIARSSDAQAIADIYAPIVRDTSISFELEPPSVEQMRERIEATLQTLPWLVSEDAQGAVTGYAYASKHRERAAYQWAVDTTAYVRPDSRGAGVGKQLYRELKSILVELGYFQAFAGIALPNVASVALHESVGFTPIGVYRNVGFKGGQWRDVGWWQCALREPTEPTAPKAPKAI